jgi:hypothetical protein
MTSLLILIFIINFILRFIKSNNLNITFPTIYDLLSLSLYDLQLNLYHPQCLFGLVAYRLIIVLSLRKHSSRPVDRARSVGLFGRESGSSQRLARRERELRYVFSRALTKAFTSHGPRNDGQRESFPPPHSLLVSLSLILVPANRRAA